MKTPIVALSGQARDAVEHSERELCGKTASKHKPRLRARAEAQRITRASKDIKKRRLGGKMSEMSPVKQKRVSMTMKAR